MESGERKGEERPVLPWRLVVGGLLHFAIPLYLLFLLVSILAAPRLPAATEAWARWGLHESVAFLIGFSAIVVLAGASAALADPPARRLRQRRQARDPGRSVTASRDRVQRALARLEAANWDSAKSQVATAIAQLQRGPWYHDTVAGQRLSMDLLEAANTFATALASAPSAKRAELAELAAHALGRVADALVQQAADQGRLDEGDARTIARLIDLRYGENSLPVSLEGDSRKE